MRDSFAQVVRHDVTVTGCVHTYMSLCSWRWTTLHPRAGRTTRLMESQRELLLTSAEWLMS